MAPVQINKLDIKTHELYAQNKEKLDTKYITESNAIKYHTEIAGTSTIFTSQLDILFETEPRNISWATFLPPNSYHLQTNRFFFFSLCLALLPPQTQEEKSPFIQLVKDAEKTEEQKTLDFEKEQSKLIAFFECADNLNGILKMFRANQTRLQRG